MLLADLGGDGLPDLVVMSKIRGGLGGPHILMSQYYDQSFSSLVLYIADDIKGGGDLHEGKVDGIIGDEWVVVENGHAKFYAGGRSVPVTRQ
jgi:hypothetical protein